MAPFRHTTRHHGRNIRLIKLEPGDGKQLSCSLEHVSLDDRPIYDAISYCWGNEEGSLPILCNGAALMVRRNLFDALRRFQESDNAVWLWADAICINQADMQEKNEQVPLMGSIYGQARHVKVWLGPEEEDTTKLVAIISRLSDLARFYSKKHGIPLSSLAGSDYQDIWVAAANESRPGWRSLASLRVSLVEFLRNPWFRRIWIVQEVALPQGRATIHCGNVKLSWTDFELGILFLNRSNHLPRMFEVAGLLEVAKLHRVVALVKTTARFRDVSANGTGSGLDLYWLLRTNQDAFATDPRDMVFGLLGMAASGREGSSSLPIAADYEMKVVDLYQRVTERFLADFDTLTALSGAGVFYSETRPFAPDDPLPSWVVNWGSRIIRAFFNPAADADALYTTRVGQGYDACLTSLHPKVAEVGGRVLKLSGFVLDEITACSVLLECGQTKLQPPRGPLPLSLCQGVSFQIVPLLRVVQSSCGMGMQTETMG